MGHGGLNPTGCSDEIRIFGVGTSPSLGYPRSLGRVLQQRHRNSKVRVVNLSASGVGTGRQRPRFFEALDLDADAIVLHPHGTSEFKPEPAVSALLR